MSCASHRKHISKLNIFSQTIKVSDCFLQYSVFIWQNYTLIMPKLVSVKFIPSQTHTALAGSRLYFHPSRSNLFAVASDNGLCRRKALSTTLRLAYLRIGSPNNHRSTVVCAWLSPAQVGFVAHDFALPRAQTYP